VKNFFEKIFVVIYAIGFFLHFEIQEYKMKRKHKRYINGSIK